MIKTLNHNHFNAPDLSKLTSFTVFPYHIVDATPAQMHMITVLPHVITMMPTTLAFIVA
jgi:hypothetical protein